MRISLLLLVALAACTPPSHPPASAQSDGTWDRAETRPAIPKDDASRGRFWEYLAPATLPPPQQAPSSPQTDIPQTDFGLAAYAPPAPVENLAPPGRMGRGTP